MKKVHLLFILSTLLSGQSALASQKPQYQDMSSDIAKSLVTSALKICHSENKTGVVAVVDKGGNLVALQRDDNVGPHNTQAAQKKRTRLFQLKATLVSLLKKQRLTPKLKT
nr:heme-binding protein [Escherichia albertii]